MIKHAIKWLKDKNIYTEYICCVYPTSVFLNKKDLLDGYKKIKANKWDFVFTAAKSEKSAYHAFEKKIWISQNVILKIFSKRSQVTSETYQDAGHFYWARSEVWLSNKKIISKNRIRLLFQDLEITI